MQSVNYQPLTPLSFLKRSSQVFPDVTAVVDGDVRLTYQEFEQYVRAMGGALRKLGVNQGDRVAFLEWNGLPLLAAHYGIPWIGAVLVAINTRLAHPEIAQILQHSGAKVLVAAADLLPDPQWLKKECPDLERIIAINNDGGELSPGVDLTYQEFIESGRQDPAEMVPVDENDLISINYTSGTTGRPKGAMYTHRGAYLNAIGDALEVGLSPSTRYLWTLPMFHCNGWCYTWAVTAVGGRHVSLPKVRPEQVFDLIKKERITHLCAAPTVLIDLATYAVDAEISLDEPLMIMTGGAAPAPQVIANMESVGATVMHLYGLTETYGPSTFCQWRPEWDELPFAERAALKARQGVADLMVEQRVVRPDMTDVNPDGQEVGELVIRGNVVMKGYYNDPEATAEAFRGGWFHTGDLAVMHPNGYVEITDRAKDIIISGGENISTLEVENVLYSHPAVLEVAVVASPHPRWGEVPKAFVVLRPGHQVTGEMLEQHCRAHLAGYKCPKRYEFVDALPKTSTGKIQKFVLRQREMAAQSGS